MNENSEVIKTIKYLKSLEGCFPIRITPGVYGSRGKSDILVCYMGIFVAIEMKVGSNKPSDMQLKFLRDVQAKGGGLSVPCWSCSEVMELMKCIGEKMDQHGMKDTLRSFQVDVIGSLQASQMKAAKKGMVNFIR